ncbi:hypothetical protein MIND_01351500 [Mycena indigotica]|uniref:Uncharacterized protein n=1 Tax=Mycena indigotica TaxID=2126181 RepID=A0A8H6RXV7_9AGAR|nr:uncharacterized protein MIND_01351500 [Mycena indigotica]KAF7289775.1 hypothetical protein MIND_01351500 [Mycena indigotica]
MSTTNTSTTAPIFVPQDGAFAILRIDPIASLAHLNDPEALKAAESMEFHDYVVFVPGTREMRHPMISFRAEVVEFLVQGLPPDVPSLCIDSAMSIPIFPTSHSQHPGSREPLRTLKPLPWGDCYLSPFLRETVRCPTVITTDPLCCSMVDEDISRHDDMIDLDRLRQSVLFSRSLVESSGLDAVDNSDEGIAFNEEQEASEGLDESPMNTTFSYIADDVDAQSRSTTNDELEDLDEDEDLYLCGLIFPKEAPSDMLTVNITHDLSRVGELRNPQSFYDERAQIRRIAAESMDRLRQAVEQESEELYATKTAVLLAARKHERLVLSNDPESSPNNTSSILSDGIQITSATTQSKLEVMMQWIRSYLS